MPTFNNIDNLTKYINESIQDSSEKMAEEIQNKLREYVENNLYNRYAESMSPNSYERTYNLINSIKVSSNKIDDTFYFQIYFTDSVEYQHYDYAGKAVYIAQWVNDGWAYKRPEVNYMEDTIQFLNDTKEYINTFVKSLKDKGFKTL